MRNSRRAQNQKKASRVNRFRKQIGSSQPVKKRQFTVFYNLTFRNGDFLTRRLNPYELGVFRHRMRETKDGHRQFADLEVGLVEQFQEPYDSYYFSLIIIVNNDNLSNDQAMDLIK